MKVKLLARSFLVAGVFALGYFAGNFQDMDAQAATERSIPKAYGSFKAAWGDSLVFEASDGTIRVVQETGDLSIVYKRN